MPLVVEGPEIGEAPEDGIVVGNGVGLVGQIAPPAPAFGLEAEEVVVATTEQRGAQGGGDPEVVGGVVDGPQDHEQVPDGPAGVDERARLGPEGDAGGVEGVLQERQ